MSNTLEELRGKIGSAEDLESVVRSMKSLAAASIGQYEKSVRAVGDYFHTVELGLYVCLRQQGREATEIGERTNTGRVSAVVFGSDQGLVGQFNDVVTSFAALALAALPGKKTIWAVGERVHVRLADAGLAPVGLFPVPPSVGAITSLIEQVLVETAARRVTEGAGPLYLFYNSPKTGSQYAPQSQRLLPLDHVWQQGIREIHWPTADLPEAVGGREETLRKLIDEYLFVSLFLACAESLASENASRLAAMQRAEKNIDESLMRLHRTFNRQRQSSIDEELFDVIAGFEAQTGSQTQT